MDTAIHGKRKKPTIGGWSAFRRMVRRCSLGGRFRSGCLLRRLVGRTRDLGLCRRSDLQCGQDLFQPAEDFVVIYVFGSSPGAVSDCANLYRELVAGAILEDVKVFGIALLAAFSSDRLRRLQL